MKKTATALVVVAFVVTGCSSEPAKVSGLLDEVKMKPAVSEKSHTEVRDKKKSVCVSKNKKGVCTSHASRADGTEKVKVVDRKAKSAVYCVELDNVNGKPTDDDQWFEVSLSTFSKWADAGEGVKVTDMEYTVTGCTQ